MKIVIDARFLGPEGTGIGRYVEKLIENLQKLDNVNDYVVLLNNKNFDLFKPQNSHFTKLLADARWYSFKEQMILPILMRKVKPDLLHVPHFNVPVFYKGKLVVTIHDLTKSDFSSSSASTRNKLFYWIKQLAYEFTIRRAAHRSEFILTPSNTSKEKIKNELSVKKEKIKVTYEASDEKFFEWGEKSIPEDKIKEVLNKYYIKRPFIIYVGNGYPYKNLDRLMGALKLLPGNISLVNPCIRSVFYDRLADQAKKMGVADRVILPGYVPDEDLAVLYKVAEAYVFPSLSEGFGIPALEAMACKLPVVCSDIPVLREICGDNAVFFDPTSIPDIASKLAQVINDKKLREKLVREGLERAHQFSWKKMAAQTLQVYEEVAK